MSNVPISPEQRQAEAAQPKLELGDRIILHRLMFRKDAGLPLKLHQRDGDDSGLGAPFNSIFAAYLDGTGHGDSWNAALLYVREHVCRKTHSKHWAPIEWGGSLCYRLTSHVIRLEWGIPETMGRLGLTDEALTGHTLETALRDVERRLEWVMRGDPPEVRREPAEWMATPIAHKPLDGLHAVDCPQCRAAA
jgi:hypothetical protein